jgi:serine/threonine-protein kinase
LPTLLIQDQIGAGGMAAVFPATDTRLGREVALEILPPVFAADVEKLARFRREAQVLTSLQHPNIASIYGIESGLWVVELPE